LKITAPLTDDEINEIDEKVSDYFTNHGIDEKDEVNDIGMLCESIMDILGEL
jgi:hypothetical protein